MKNDVASLVGRDLRARRNPEQGATSLENGCGARGTARPTSWPRVRLGEVCEIVAGQSPEGRFYTSDASFTEFHQGSKNFGEWELKVSGVYTSVVTKIVEAGTLLISVRAPVGDLNVTPRRICIGRGLAGLLPNAMLDRDFLCYFLTAETKAVNEAAGAGSCFSSISVKQLASLSLPLPPLPVQHKIVARLERELGAVDKLAKKFEELEAAAEAEFKAELKETFEEIKHRGEMHRRSSASKGRFGEAEPEGRASVCETRRLGDVCERITKGTTPTSVGFAFTDTGVNFVKVESFSDDGDLIETRVAHVSRECHEALKRSQLKEGDVLFSIAGALGRVAKVDARLLPANTNQALAIIRLSSTTEIDIGYLMLALRGPSVSAQIDDMKKATAQANLSLQNVRDFEIPIPPLPVQREVVARLDAAKAKKEKLVAAARRGRETVALMRKAILKEAFE